MQGDPLADLLPAGVGEEPVGDRLVAEAANRVGLCQLGRVVVGLVPGRSSAYGSAGTAPRRSAPRRGTFELFTIVTVGRCGVGDQGYRWVVLSDVPIAVTGSVATDHLMSFPGLFADSLVVDQLDKIALSFLVEDLEVRRGGCAANIAFGLAALGVTADPGRRRR